MKFTKFVILFAVLSFSLSLRTKLGCDKNDSCTICQKTIYNLKFNFEVRCYSSRCKNTCWKVEKEWNQPDSKFQPFLNDSVGKCDACFRSGYCSASHCVEQKRREEDLIASVIDNHDFVTSAVDTQELSKMVDKITNNESVNFEKIAKKVRKETKEALRMKDIEKKNQLISKSLQSVLEYGNK